MTRNAANLNRDYIYTAAFLNPAAFEQAIANLGKRLDLPIAAPHMTFRYRPRWVDESLFGETILLLAIGYGNDGVNEGLLVEIRPESRALADRLGMPSRPHITLSVSETGRPVDTAGLSFRPIEPFCLTAVYGAWHRNGRAVCSPP